MLKYPKGFSSKLCNQFWFEIYPDEIGKSVPTDWLQRLEDWHIQCAVSPLHDRDTKPDGSAKKPHYHVIVKFDGGKSEKQCQAICDDIGGANGYMEVIVDLKSAVRYLSHIDCKSKTQYSPFDITSFGGFSVGKYYSDDDDDQIDLVFIELRDYICANHIKYYSDIIDYAADHDRIWLRYLRRGLGALVKDYILSVNYKWSQILKNT